MFISGLSSSRKKQLSLFDIESESSNKDKSDEKLQNIIDNIRDKYGNDIIKYGNSR